MSAGGRDHRIRLTAPAREWTEALPLGNGHLAAMCFADPAEDRFALNHDTLWSGSPRNERAGGVVDAATARAALAEARAALAAGDRTGADAAVRRLQARYGQAYLPLGDLRIHRERAGSLRWRELDLSTAVHTAVADDGTVRRSYVSAPDGVLVVETELPTPTDLTITFDHPLHELGRTVDGGVAGAPGRGAAGALEVRLRAPSDVAPHHEAADPPVTWSAEPGDAVQAVVRVAVVTDGRVRAVDGAGAEPEGLAVASGAAAGGSAEGDVGPGGALGVVGATRVRVLLACETTFVAMAELPSDDLDGAALRAARTVDAAVGRDADTLLSRHVADHGALYDRFEIVLPGADGKLPGDAEMSGAAALPDTAARLAAARATGMPMVVDPALAALLVHYGRYLLIASSRAGTLPATLQGVWNAELRPPWSGAYTVNINTQMNYWGAQTTGLGECEEPLFDLVAAVARNGTEIAERLYGTRGWVAHHNTDAWAYASPVGQGVADPAWAFWPMAGPWLVAQLVARVRFAPTHAQRVELTAEVWPVVVGAVHFLRDWVVELEPGVWGTGLSTSPENVFAAGNPAALAGGRDDRPADRAAATGTHAAVGRHAALDAELVHDVATGALELVAVLRRAASSGGAVPSGGAGPVEGTEPTDLVDTGSVEAEARWLLDHVALPGVGPDGGVAEWYDGEVGLDPHHRHVSMLYGTFPGTRDQTEPERAAARRSLDRRGDDSSGWSLVWKTALRARLGQGDKVADLLELLARAAVGSTAEHAGGLYPNLFAAHPPFQIDGNLGLVGAVLECLVQSHRREGGRTVLDLLPALPPAWSTGVLRGARVRPGLRLDLVWRDGRVEQFTLTAEPGADEVTVVVRGGGVDAVVTPAGSGAPPRRWSPR